MTRYVVRFVASIALLFGSLHAAAQTEPIGGWFSPRNGTDRGDYTDLWWNPGESGWGIAVLHQFSVMFLAWYVYDSAGKPVWYVASNCGVNASLNGCSGVLYRTTGPAFGPTFDSAPESAPWCM